jgi:hypothetical protein
MANPQYTSGRGGAGNFKKERTTSGGAEELVTPTIKSELYTTGRGGQGNMAKNDFGTTARTAQDVETPATIPQSTGDNENYHYGRGGAANITKRSEGEDHDKKSEATTGEKAKGLLEKLGLKKN